MNVSLLHARLVLLSQLGRVLIPLIQFVAIHPSVETNVDSSGDQWNQEGSRARLLQLYDSFGPGVRALLEKTETPALYPLLDMAQLPRFHEDKLVVLGKAA